MASNVLFVTADQWRGASLSALGHPPVKAPRLDALGDCYRATRSLLQWRMCEDDRELANSLLTFDHGPVSTRDPWR